MTRSLLTPLLSILALLALWQAAAVTANSVLLPGPSAVFKVLGSEILSGRLPHHLGITLARLAISFIVALVLGTALRLEGNLMWTGFLTAGW
jgi:NitT/TauT family transport system permease protein